MQAQATGNRRFGLNGLKVGAAAIALLAASAIGLSTLDSVELPFAGSKQASRGEVAVPNYFSPRLGEGVRPDATHDVIVVPNYFSPLMGEGRLDVSPIEAGLDPGGTHINRDKGASLTEYVSAPSSNEQGQQRHNMGPGEGLRP